VYFTELVRPALHTEVLVLSVYIFLAFPLHYFTGRYDQQVNHSIPKYRHANTCLQKSKIFKTHSIQQNS